MNREIKIQARQCGKSAQTGELVMKQRSEGVSTRFCVKAWAESRVHVKQLNEEVVPTLQPYQRRFLAMLENQRPDDRYVRIFKPWR